MPYRFAAASDRESIVFGAARPGRSDRQIAQWIDFMQERDINRVCCLLTQPELAKYSDLLATYRDKFGVERVCWAPIADFQLAERETLIDQILPFLALADDKQERVVVHCGGGIGRTGQVLAAWLVSWRGFSNREAIAAVKNSGRNPHEAAIAALFAAKNPCQVVIDFNQLLNDCRLAIS